MLRDAPLPPRLLNLQKGLIFDTFPSPRAHHSPVAVLTAWAAGAGGGLRWGTERPVRGYQSGFGVAGAGGWQPSHPLPCPREREEMGTAQAGRGGRTVDGHGGDLSPRHPSAGSTTASCGEIPRFQGNVGIPQLGAGRMLAAALPAPLACPSLLPAGHPAAGGDARISPSEEQPSWLASA